MTYKTLMHLLVAFAPVFNMVMLPRQSMTIADRIVVERVTRSQKAGASSSSLPASPGVAFSKSQQSDSLLQPSIAYPSADTEMSEGLEINWWNKVISGTEARTLALENKSRNVIVAVIDSGVDGGHPDLVGKVNTSYEFGSPGLDECNDHGTRVAGTLAADWATGTNIQGIASGIAKIDSYNVRSGNCKLFTNILSAYDRLDGSQTDVVNMSYGAPRVNSSADALTDSLAIQSLISQNMVIVASSGNESEECRKAEVFGATIVINCVNVNSPVGYPALLSGVIAVGATDASNKVASFSNRGTSLSIVAPGKDMIGTSRLSNYGKPGQGNPVTGQFTNWGGTSAAAPMVSGVVALLKAVKPDLTPKQIKRLLETTTTKLLNYPDESRGNLGGWNQNAGYGLVNAFRAVQAVVYPPKLTISYKPWLHRTSNPAWQGHPDLNDLYRPVGYYDYSAEAALAVVAWEEGNTQRLTPDIIFSTTVQLDRYGNLIGNPITLSGIAPVTHTLCLKPRDMVMKCTDGIRLTHSDASYGGAPISVDFSNIYNLPAYSDDNFFLAGDFNNNGVIGSDDKSVFIVKLNSQVCNSVATGGPSCKPFDLDQSGAVNSQDLNLLRIAEASFLDPDTRLFDLSRHRGLIREVLYIWRPFLSSLIQQRALLAPSLLVETTVNPVYLTVGSGGNPQAYPIVGSNSDSFDVNVTVDGLSNGQSTQDATFVFMYDPGVVIPVDSNTATFEFDIANVMSFTGAQVTVNTQHISQGKLIVNMHTNGSAISCLSCQLVRVRFKALRRVSSTYIGLRVASGDETDTNIWDATTDADLATTQARVMGLTVYPSGGTARSATSVSMMPIAYINSDRFLLQASASDPYAPVTYTGFEAYYDGVWHQLGTDTYMSDGLQYDWDVSKIADQQVRLRVNVGGYAFSNTSPEIVLRLDRMAPVIIESELARSNTTPWDNRLTLLWYSEDNAGGTPSHRVFYNTDPNGNATGDWVLLCETSLTTCVIDPGFDLRSPIATGQYKLAIGISDDYGNGQFVVLSSTVDYTQLMPAPTSQMFSVEPSGSSCLATDGAVDVRRLSFVGTGLSNSDGALTLQIWNILSNTLSIHFGSEISWVNSRYAELDIASILNLSGLSNVNGSPIRIRATKSANGRYFPVSGWSPPITVRRGANALLIGCVASAPPANDKPVNRIVLSDSLVQAEQISGGYRVSGNNRFARSDITEPEFLGIGSSRAVWWSWTPQVTQRMRIDTSGSLFDTTLTVWEYLGLSRSLLSTNNDNGVDTTSTVEFTATVGMEYWIAVDGFRGANGSYQLRLTRTTPSTSNNVQIVRNFTAEGLFQTPKTSFSPGASLFLVTEFSNTAGITQTVTLTSSVSGPCGFSFASPSLINLSQGVNRYSRLFSLVETACAGQYTFTSELTHSGFLTKRNSLFDVSSKLNTRVFLPTIIR